ncbi:MAG: hypothetical protein HYS40_05100 [Gemmatimonadetes bacterium]|nr:hypothetical protein [Gemmatimonadota bacterium]
MRAVASLLLLTPAAAFAQSGLQVAGTSAVVRVRSTIGPTREVLSGAVFGVEGHAAVWRLVLNVGYGQGSVKPDSGAPAPRDVIEGRLLVGIRLVRGLSIKAGPHIRAYISDWGTQRWLFWEARLRGERTIVGGVRGYAEVWRVLSADVNVLEPFDGGQGGEAGMLVALPRSPFWGRLAYGIERAKLGGGSRLETVEGVTLAIGYGWH